MHISIKLALVIFLVFEWLVRILAVYIVPRNRKPSSAIAWLMLIMLFPTLGMLVYLLIGSPKLSKARRRKQRTMDYIIKKAVEEAHAHPAHRGFIHYNVSDRVDHLVKLTTNLGGMPAFSSNKIDLLSDYDGIFNEIVKDILQAKKFIHIEFFILVYDESTRPLIDAMAEAVKRGVKVRVLFDALGSHRIPDHRKIRKILTEIGVEWYAMLPLQLPGAKFNRPDLRDHRKIVVIDDEIGYTGSQNLVRRDYHRKDGLYYDELMVRLTGPVVTQLHAAFITDWYSESDELLTHSKAPEIELDLEATGDTLAQVMPSGPGYGNDNNLKLFTTLIHAADKKVVIVNPYFVPDDSLLIAITSAAQRGVEVIMLNSEAMDQRMVGHAQRSYYEELLKAKVRIFWYNEPVLLHSKYISIDDDIAAIGSSNLDIRSFQLNLEITLMVYDKKVVTALEKITESYLQHARPIKLGEWHARSRRNKLLDSLARLTAALQ